MGSYVKLVSGFALAGVLAACQGGQVTQGTGGTAISGAAGGSTSVDANPGLERCPETLGTLAVDDGRDRAWYGYWVRTTGVTSVEPLIRLASQQSNCFVVTSLGNERLESKIQGITDKQRNSGEFRAGSNQQRGQRVAADYFLEPAIIINNADSGALGAAAGALLGPAVGAIAGSVRTSDSVVTLSLFDIRSGVQLSAAEGSSTATNFGAALGAFGGVAGGALGGYSRTPEGKATVAAFVDAFNGMVRSVRSYRAQTVRGGLGTGGTLTVN
ncbi:MAG: hypothetical protein AAGB29_15615 [Planctomycetota bacterium]